MKLFRHGPVGKERPGVIDHNGGLRDLSREISDLSPEQLSPDRLKQLKSIDPSTLPILREEIRFGLPFAGTRQFIAIGLNYSDHAREAKMEVPKEPVIFSKAVSCLQGPNDPIVIPRGSRKTDWEVELAVVIGSTASYVPV